MKINYIDITVIIDKSGSMSGLRADTIGGFNTFLDEQRKLPGECKFTLIQFDNIYEEHYIAKNIQDVQPLTTATYTPRGTTALLDAIGRTISANSGRFTVMAEEDRPSKVIMVIITDGYENASVEYTKPVIKSMIEHREDEYQWEIIFLGANMDAISEGASLGTKFEKSMTWDASSKGVAGAYAALSQAAGEYRTSGKMEFTVSHRNQAAGN